MYADTTRAFRCLWQSGKVRNKQSPNTQRALILSQNGHPVGAEERELLSVLQRILHRSAAKVLRRDRLHLRARKGGGRQVGYFGGEFRVKFTKGDAFLLP